MEVKFTQQVSKATQAVCEHFTQNLIATGVLYQWHNAVGKSADHQIGTTWEHINGIAANSRPGPDQWITTPYGKVGLEHKAGGDQSDVLQSLTCQEADGRGVNRWLLENYSCYSVKSQRNGLYSTLYCGRPTPVGSNVFMLSYPNADGMQLAINGTVVCGWSRDKLKTVFERKLNHVIVEAKGIERWVGPQRQFYFNKVSFHTKFDVNRLLKAYDEGNATVDLRGHLKDYFTRTGLRALRNHGTCFRITSEAFPTLFQATARLNIE